MRKEVNYIEEYRELWNDMKSTDTTPMPEIGEWRDEMKLCLDYSDLESSQYKLVKNTDKWHKVIDIIFPWLSMIAEIQGAHVIMDIDDKTFYGSIKIMSEALVMVNMSDSRDKDIFAAMTQLADDVFISSENGLAILTCTFSLYDRVKISDKTDELNQIKNNIALLRNKQGKKRIFDLD